MHYIKELEDHPGFRRKLGLILNKKSNKLEYIGVQKDRDGNKVYVVILDKITKSTLALMFDMTLKEMYQKIKTQRELFVK